MLLIIWGALIVEYESNLHNYHHLSMYACKNYLEQRHVSNLTLPTFLDSSDAQYSRVTRSCWEGPLIVQFSSLTTNLTTTEYNTAQHTYVTEAIMVSTIKI